MINDILPSRIVKLDESAASDISDEEMLANNKTETEQELADRLSKNIHKVFKEVRAATPTVHQTGAGQGTKAAVEIAKLMADSKQSVKEEVRELEAQLQERLKAMQDENNVETPVNAESAAAESKNEVVKEFTSGNLLPGQDEKDTDSLQVDAQDVPFMLQLTIEQRNDALTKLTATQATMVRLRNERKVIEDALAFKGIVMKELISEYFDSMSPPKSN